MFRAITALMLREMATTHGKATGGYVWRLAEPVPGILLFSYIAGLAFRAQSLGISFPIFFAGGWLPYLCFNDIQRQVASSIIQTRYLLTYPAVTLIDAIAARAVLALITQVAIFYLIVSAFEFTLTTDTAYRFERIIAGMCMAAALGLGIGIFNCFFWHYCPVWQRIWNILTRPLMLLSGVLFIYEDVPAGYQDLIWWNPLVHITGYVRSGFFYQLRAGLGVLHICLSICVDPRRNRLVLPAPFLPQNPQHALSPYLAGHSARTRSGAASGGIGMVESQRL